MAKEKPLIYFKVYTQSNCILECLTNATLKKCGCVSFYMPRKFIQFQTVMYFTTCVLKTLRARKDSKSKMRFSKKAYGLNKR